MMSFTAQQAFPCRSGIGAPHSVEIGTQATYVEPGPRMICAACLPQIAPAPPPTDSDVSTPDAAPELCQCTGQRDWTNRGDGVFVHPACGRPGFAQPVVIHSNMDELRARDAERAENAAVEALVGPATDLHAPAAGSVGAPVHTASVTDEPQGSAALPPPTTAPTAAPDGSPAPAGGCEKLDLPGGGTAIVCGPKRGPGRPRKVVAPGLIVEKLPGADKWCIVHESSGTPIVVGISSKAKTAEPLARFGGSHFDWTDADILTNPFAKMWIANEQMRLVNVNAYREDLYRDGLANGADSSGGPGESAGTVSGGVPPTEGAERPGGEGSREAEGLDQGGITTAVPGGGRGDSHEPESADPDENGTPGIAADSQQGATGGAPGILGIVGGIAGVVVPDPVLTEPAVETREGHTVVWPDGPPPQAAAPAATAGPVGAVGGAVMPGTVIDSTKPSLAAFFAGTKSVQLAGSSPWAAAYAAELREIVSNYANNTERNLQVHLGPSEIGTPCDRQVIGKLVGFPTTNHVSDPWPSFMGTAGHAAMELVFGRQNEREGWERFFTERKVTPHEDHRGTSDLYDGKYLVVDDHKFLGESAMAKLRSPEGPPIKYQFQLKLYARGYRNLGYRVDRIAIIGWPRTGSSLDGMYVWDHVLTPADDEQIDQLFARMAWRQDIAARIRAGQMYLNQVPAVPDEDDCYFCPFYRPQSAHDGGPGCPGHAGN